MASFKKYSDTKLQELVRNGLTQAEIARKLGVSTASVCQRLRRLKVVVAKDLTLRSAPAVIRKELDTVGQLQKINRDANELLNLLMRWNRGEDDALQILETQVRKVRIGRGEDAQEVTEYKLKDPRELALKAMAEIRGQLKLQLEIFQALYDMQAVAQFQQEVLAVIGECSPDARETIIRRLAERSAIRSTIEWNRPEIRP
ncbi:MAG: hypothetical protein ACLQBD_01955 [Syntrophobacteraceae bacterium]